MDYIAGYTIVNDVTYRDFQRRTLQWLQGKTVEGSAPMGPWIVTSDELPDPKGLEMVLTVNGEERQRTNTANQVFTPQYLVSFLSNINDTRARRCYFNRNSRRCRYCSRPTSMVKRRGCGSRLNRKSWRVRK